MSDYDFMNVNLDDAQTPVVVQDDKEHQLTVIDFEVNKEKFYVKLRVKPIDCEGFVRSFNKFLFFPKPDDDAERRNTKLCQIRDFNAACKINGPVTDPQAYVGATFWATLGTEEVENMGTVNNIKRLVVPK